MDAAIPVNGASSAWDEEYDLVVVGSGAAGLTAAITAARKGLKPLVIEKAAVWGGTSALSGGGVWAPANSLMLAAGLPDTTDEAFKFLREVVPDEGPATAPERQLAYVTNAPKMVDFMIDAGMQWTADQDHPDYLSEARYAKIGRDMDSKVYDGKKLGPWLKTMRRSPAPLAVRLEDIPPIGRGDRRRMAYVFLRHHVRKFIRQEPLACGASLVAQLMSILQGFGAPVWLNCALNEVVVQSGRATGAVVTRDGRRRRIGARGGVVLAAGGFAHDAATRKKLQNVTGEWSSASPDDTGDIIKLADGIGAMTALLDEAWWGCAVLYPDGTPGFCHWERSVPFGIAVGPDGKRFTNESEDYYLFGQALVRLGVTTRAWLIMDARHRQRYTFQGMPPGRTPQVMIDAGFFIKADTLSELAEKCEIDAAGLQATIARFNGFAKSGIDQDFHRGEWKYDRYWGDPAHKPSPNLGAIERGPFLATRLVAGDLGTKGGYVTDANAQVLSTAGAPIDGLYAAGNATASVMGRTYPGPGVTLGPAMTFAYIAAQHAARRSTNR